MAFCLNTTCSPNVFHQLWRCHFFRNRQSFLFHFPEPVSPFKCKDWYCANYEKYLGTTEVNFDNLNFQNESEDSEKTEFYFEDDSIDITDSVDSHFENNKAV